MFFYVSILLQFLMVSSGVYFFIISIVGWNPKNKSVEKTHDPMKRFALVVAAHNEEKVIKHIIESFISMKYPRELYDIFVIADNCTDNTASIAREAGALVYERENKVEVGKGFAVRWMFDQIFELDTKYDAISVFDADNLVSKNFLCKMNDMLCNGHQVIQSYLDVKNPYDSLITLTLAVTYWATNRIFNQSRSNLNMWCTIGGTGFCVSTEVLQKIPWDATCLTEDLEYTVKLVLNDIKISWCSEAAVYDEKPLTFMQSWNQRKRWMQGHVDVFSRFFLQLFKKGLKERKLTALDLAIYNFQPINIVITFFISVIISITSLFYNTYSVSEVVDKALLQPWALYLMLTFLKVFPILFLLLPVIVLIAEKRMNFKVLLGVLFTPIFSLSWIPIIILGIINRNKKVWSHTVHMREIKISDLEKA